MGNRTISQLSVGNLPKGKVGQLYGNPHLYHEESFSVSNGRAASVSTIKIDTATNAETYSFDIFGETISFLSASTDKADITAGLKAAFDANPVARGLATVVDDEVDELTITANFAGVDLALALNANAAKMTLAETTAESEGTKIPFGRLVSLDANGNLVLFSAGTAQEVRLTPVVADAAGVEPWIVEVTVEGETYGASFIGDGSQTIAEIVTGLTTNLNAVLPADTVLAKDDSTHLTLSAESPGTNFEVNTTAGDGNSFIESVQTANDGLGDAVGITRYSYEEASETINDPTDVGYRPGTDANVLLTGEIYVEGGDTATRSSSVYVGTANGEEGKFFTSDGTGRLKVVDGSIKWKEANVLTIRKGF